MSPGNLSLGANGNAHRFSFEKDDSKSGLNWNPDFGSPRLSLNSANSSASSPSKGATDDAHEPIIATSIGNARNPSNPAANYDQSAQNGDNGPTKKIFSAEESLATVANEKIMNMDRTASLILDISMINRDQDVDTNAVDCSPKNDKAPPPKGESGFGCESHYESIKSSFKTPIANTSTILKNTKGSTTAISATTSATIPKEPSSPVASSTELNSGLLQEQKYCSQDIPAKDLSSKNGSTTKKSDVVSKLDKKTSAGNVVVNRAFVANTKKASISDDGITNNPEKSATTSPSASTKPLVPKDKNSADINSKDDVPSIKTKKNRGVRSNSIRGTSGDPSPAVMPASLPAPGSSSSTVSLSRPRTPNSPRSNTRSRRGSLASAIAKIVDSDKKTPESGTSKSIPKPNNTNPKPESKTPDMQDTKPDKTEHVTPLKPNTNRYSKMFLGLRYHDKGIPSSGNSTDVQGDDDVPKKNNPSDSANYQEPSNRHLSLRRHPSRLLTGVSRKIKDVRHSTSMVFRQKVHRRFSLYKKSGEDLVQEQESTNLKESDKEQAPKCPEKEPSSDEKSASCSNLAQSGLEKMTTGKIVNRASTIIIVEPQKTAGNGNLSDRLNTVKRSTSLAMRHSVSRAKGIFTNKKSVAA